MRRQRRKSPRVRKHLKVTYGDGELSSKGFISDVSTHGIFLIGRELHDIGTRLHLHFLDTEDDFYAEGLVVRQKRVPAELRRVEREGMGIRLVSVQELIRSVVPALADHRPEFNLVVSSRAELEPILVEQLPTGVMLVPADEEAPAVNSIVEFSIERNFGAPRRPVDARGRVLQHLHESSRTMLVVEVKDVADVRRRLQDLAG